MGLFGAMSSLSIAQEETISDADEFVSAAPTWRLRGEYLHWWASRTSLPALVSSSPPGTIRQDAGVLGTLGATVLYGNNSVGGGDRSGGRLTLSRWLDDESITGIEFSGFIVGDDFQSGDFTASSNGVDIISRPFFNAVSGQEDAELVSFPGVLAGRVTVSSYSEIYSGAALIRQNLGLGSRGRLDLLGGYRYLRFRESLTITENLGSIDPGGLVPIGTTFDIEDRFSVANDFHGFDAGLSAEFFIGDRLTLELLAKAAIGEVTRRSTISGRSIVTVPANAPTTTAGGLLALPTNIGSRVDRDFGVIPEFGINGNLAISGNTSLQFGYSLILFNDILRAGQQIDRSVNTSQIGGNPLVGTNRPEFGWRSSDLLLHGLSIGIETRW
jgi:hypothetical protein